MEEILATKKQGKTPAPEPNVPVEPSGAPDPTPEPIPEPTNIPEKYQGKSLEDVITMHQEAEKRMGSMGDELGKTRQEREKAQQDLQYVQQWYQTQQARPQEPEPQSPTTSFDYDNPVESVDKIVEKKLQGWAEEQKKHQQQMQHQEATQNFLRGKDSALRGNRGLYEGIERDVETTVWNAYLGGIIPRWNLSDPSTWEDAAWLIHKRNKNWDKLVPPKPKPMSPTPTDTPGGIKPPSVEPAGEPLEFDAHGEHMLNLAEKSGFKKDEFIKEVKSRRKQFGPSREGE